MLLSFGMEILQFHLRGPRGRVSSTDGLVHADLSGDEELLHGHHVHVGEVLDHKPLALVQVVVTSTLHKLFKCTLSSKSK